MKMLQKGKLYEIVYVNPNGSGKNNLHFGIKGDRREGLWLPAGKILLCLSHKKCYVSSDPTITYRVWKFLCGDKILTWHVGLDADDHSFLPKAFKLVK